MSKLLLPLLLWLGLLGLLGQQEAWRWGLARLFPEVTNPIFERQTLLALTLEHLALSALAWALVLAVGVPLALWVARGSGAALAGAVESLVAVGQTFPPAAVLVLALPLLGFGGQGAVLALWLYGLLPVVRSTLEGLRALPEGALEAATGMGFSARQRLWRIEVPLALPLILAGLRTSAVLILATATLAPLVGGGGLGVPIMAGLAVSNLALVVQGAVAVALLALLLDFSLVRLEAALTPWR